MHSLRTEFKRAECLCPGTRAILGQPLQDQSPGDPKGQRPLQQACTFSVKTAQDQCSPGVRIWRHCFWTLQANISHYALPSHWSRWNFPGRADEPGHWRLQVLSPSIAWSAQKPVSEQGRTRQYSWKTQHPSSQNVSDPEPVVSLLRGIPQGSPSSGLAALLLFRETQGLDSRIFSWQLAWL